MAIDFSDQRFAMVASQVRTFDVVRSEIIEAMASLPREMFVSDSKQAVAYVDDIQSFPSGRFMLTPMSLARLLQCVDIQKHESGLRCRCNNWVFICISGSSGRYRDFD